MSRGLQGGVNSFEEGAINKSTHWFEKFINKECVFLSNRWVGRVIFMYGFSIFPFKPLGDAPNPDTPHTCIYEKGTLWEVLFRTKCSKA